MATEPHHLHNSTASHRSGAETGATLEPDSRRWREEPPAPSAPQRSSAARYLGYLSLALGAVALFMPNRLARLTGLEQHRLASSCT
jgi:hypothetical protein